MEENMRENSVPQEQQSSNESNKPLMLKSRIPLLSVIAILLFVIVIAVSFFVLILLTAARYFYQPPPQKVIVEVTSTPLSNMNSTANNPLDNTSDKKVVMNEDLFLIKFPEGWQRVSDKTWEDNYKDRVIRYENNNNDFFEVTIDPAGRGVSHDETWVYNFDENSKKLVFDSIRSPCESPDSPFCEIGDNKLNIFITVHDGNSLIEIKNHTYIFFAGNSKQEKNIDKQLYRDIVENITFK